MNTITNINFLLNKKFNNKKKSHCDNACESHNSVLKNCFICHKSGHFAFECPEKNNRKKYRFLFKKKEDKFNKNLIKLINNLNNYLSKKNGGKCRENKKNFNLNNNLEEKKKDKFYFRNLIKKNEESRKEIKRKISKRKGISSIQIKNNKDSHSQFMKELRKRGFIRENIEEFKIDLNQSLNQNKEKFLKIKEDNLNLFNEDINKLFEEKYQKLFNNCSVVRNPINTNLLPVDSKETALKIREVVVGEVQESDNNRNEKPKLLKEENEKDNKKEIKNKEKQIKEEIKEEIKENKESEDSIEFKLNKYGNKEKNKGENHESFEKLSVISSVSSLVSSTSQSSLSKEDLNNYKKKRYEEIRKSYINLINKRDMKKKDLVQLYNNIQKMIKYKDLFNKEVDSFKRDCKENLNYVYEELKSQNDSHCQSTTALFG